MLPPALAGAMRVNSRSFGGGNGPRGGSGTRHGGGGPNLDGGRGGRVGGPLRGDRRQERGAQAPYRVDAQHYRGGGGAYASKQNEGQKPLLPDCMGDSREDLLGDFSPVTSPALMGYVEMLSTPELLGLNDGGGRGTPPPPPLALPAAAIPSAAPAASAAPGSSNKGRRASPPPPCPSPTPTSASQVEKNLINSPTPEYKSTLGSFLLGAGGSEGDRGAMTRSQPVAETLKSEMLRPSGRTHSLEDATIPTGLDSLLELSPCLAPTSSGADAVPVADLDGDWAEDLISH